MLKFGCASSSEKSSFAAGSQAAKGALKQGAISCPDALIAFCSGNIDADEFFRGMQSVVGTGTPIIGGSAVGIITNDLISYDGYSSGVAALQLKPGSYQISAAGDLSEDGMRAGEKLVEGFSGPFEGSSLLVFYDSLQIVATAESPPVLNPSSTLITGLEKRLGPDIPILGAGLLADFHFTLFPKLFSGSCTASDHVAGLLLGKEINVYYRIMHGCDPLDGIYHHITKAEGAVVYEIDNRPAVEIIDGIYGDQGWRRKHPVDLLTIGVNYGERLGDPDESAYVNRLITGALPDGTGIGMFEPDLTDGSEIQFMLRDSSRMIESAADNASELVKRILEDKRIPRFGLYIDCAGRAAALSNTPTEEAAEIQKILNHYDIPLLGFYSGVEVAPCLQKSRGLDWTGVLWIIAE